MNRRIQRIRKFIDNLKIGEKFSPSELAFQAKLKGSQEVSSTLKWQPDVRKTKKKNGPARTSISMWEKIAVEEKQ